jgi:hypothetical protein
MATKSHFKVECKNGSANWEFPAEVTLALSAPLYPLTEGKVLQVIKTVTTEETATDAVATAETALKQRKAVCIFKHAPASGEPRLHRISIPAVAIGDTGVYSELSSKGEIIPPLKTGTAPGKDGSELAAMFKTAMALDGTLTFMSGKVLQVSTKG